MEQQQNAGDPASPSRDRASHGAPNGSPPSASPAIASGLGIVREVGWRIYDGERFMALIEFPAGPPNMPAGVVWNQIPVMLTVAQGIVTGTDETRSGSAERSEVEPGPEGMRQEIAALITQVERLTAERDEVRAAERALSDAYVRVRAKLPGAFDTPHAPSAGTVWAITEAAADTLAAENETLRDVADAARYLQQVSGQPFLPNKDNFKEPSEASDRLDKALAALAAGEPAR